jgi:hypothetical protein
VGSQATEAKKWQNKRRKLKIRARELTKTRKFRAEFPVNPFEDLSPLDIKEISIFSRLTSNLLQHLPDP